MLRTFSRLGPIGLSGFFPLQKDGRDTVVTEKPTTIYGEPMREITGMDRLKAMFSIDEFGAISDSLNSVLQCTFLSSFVGGIYGGALKGRIAYTNFMESNQATMFHSNMDAKKKLQDTLAVAFGKGAFHVSWRLAAFTAVFTLTTNMLMTYNGKTSVWHYIAGGAMAGSVYKAQMGPRAMVVGGTVGTMLGAICGSIIVLILDLGGASMEDIHYWQHQWRIQRREAVMNAYGKMNENSSDPLITAHDIQLKNNPELRQKV